MKTAIASLFILAALCTPAHAGRFIYWNGYTGQCAAGAYGPYGGVVRANYDGVGAWRNDDVYPMWQPGYGGYGYGYGGYGYGGYGYGFGGYMMPYQPSYIVSGYQGAIPGVWTNGFFVPGW
jgi:hypothetical protein